MSFSFPSGSSSLSTSPTSNGSSSSNSSSMAHISVSQSSANTNGSALKQLPPPYLVCDWGTSNLRVYLLHPSNGSILHSYLDAQGGMMKVNDENEKQWGREIEPFKLSKLKERFQFSLDRAIAHLYRTMPDKQREWSLFLSPASTPLPVVMCGMVGSRQGWYEVPYIQLPASLSSLTSSLTSFTSSSFPSRSIYIVPGLLSHSKSPLQSSVYDVMRGEETQLMGLPESSEESARIVCLPGTHSKWVVMKGNTVLKFSTYMTGEVFSLLCTHSILGKLMAPIHHSSSQSSSSSSASGSSPSVSTLSESDLPAFRRGVSLSKSNLALLNTIFSARVLGLLSHLPPASIRPYLSGVLIGHECASALAAFQADLSMSGVSSGGASSATGTPVGVPILLVGTSHLIDLYSDALQLLGQETERCGDTCHLGLYRISKLLRTSSIGNLLSTVDDVKTTAGMAQTKKSAAAASAASQQQQKLSTASGSAVSADAALAKSVASLPVPFISNLGSQPMSESTHRLLTALKRCPLIAILRGIQPAAVESVAAALVGVGFSILEIPLNSPDALRSLSLLASFARSHEAKTGQAIIVGAGTVITAADVTSVASLGLSLIVTPHADVDTVREAKRQGLMVVAGCATITEMFSMIYVGADAIKLFPAEQLSPSILRSLRSVIPPSTLLIPVGGITSDLSKLKEWVSAGASGFGLGSALFQHNLSQEEIISRAKLFRDRIAQLPFHFLQSETDGKQKTRRNLLPPAL